MLLREPETQSMLCSAGYGNQVGWLRAHLVYHSVQLRCPRHEQVGGPVQAKVGFVGGHRHDSQLVGLVQLLRFRRRCAL